MEEENKEKSQGGGQGTESFTLVSNWTRRWTGPAGWDDAPEKTKMRLVCFVPSESEAMNMYLVRCWLARDKLVNN